MKIMLKCFFTVLLVFIAFSLKAQLDYVTKSDARVRSGPGSKYKSLGVIKSGEKILVIDTSNSSWYRIVYKTKTGFLSSKLLNPVFEMSSAGQKQQDEKVIDDAEQTKSNSTTPYIAIAAIIFLLVFVIVSSKNKKEKPENSSQLDLKQPSPVIKEIIPKKSIPLANQHKNRNIARIQPIASIEPGSTGFKVNNNEELAQENEPINLPGEEVDNNANEETKQVEINIQVEEVENTTEAERKEEKDQKGLEINLIIEAIRKNADEESANPKTEIQSVSNENTTKGLEKDDLHLGLRDRHDDKELTKPRENLFQINDYSVIDVTDEKYLLPQVLTDNPSFTTTHETDYNYLAEYWGLGTKYKGKLKLTDDEVKILDSLIDTDNKFNSIEFVAIELIRLFFDLLNHLSDEFSRAGTSIEEQTNKIAEIELTQRYKLWKNSESYISQLPGFANSVTQVIYKIGENSLRDHFGVGRKIDLKYYLLTEDALAEFNERFYKLIEKYIPNHLMEMKVCDEQNEVQLNEYTKSRWKNKLELLKANGDKSGYTEFYDQVLAMGRQNKNNPSVENIFFDASKFISKIDKVAALKLYAYYVYHDLQSATFDNKQLNKTIQKSLFNTDLQLREFELIINKLIEDKDIEKAIESVSNIYTTKRKKIQLDSSKIKEVQEKHSDTVELLNEYLKDEDEGAEIELKPDEAREVELVINYSQASETSSIYKESKRLSENQVETLNLFSKRGFTLSISEFDTFVKSKGVFKNSLIESINEIYFELLDDVLIEEDEESITLTETYYSKITN